MQIRINPAGDLYIQRGMQDKRAECPWTDEVRPCGDWCALFGEPDHHGLVLCYATLEGEVIDERPQPVPPPPPPKWGGGPNPYKICQVCGIALNSARGVKVAHFKECHPEYRFYQKDSPDSYSKYTFCGIC